MSKLRRTFTVVLGLAAVLTLSYPAASQWLDASAQVAASRDWEAATSSTNSEYLDEMRVKARAFNHKLAGLADNEVEYESTLGLPTTDVMARIVIPKIELDQPIRHGMSEDVLVRGVGHAELSSLPIGEPDSHVVLGGHRGMADSVGFTRLPELVTGDEFVIDSLGQKLTYRVIATETLEPKEAAVHPIEPGRDLVTLLTCTPLGINSHRFVVTAERVEEVAAPSALPNVPGFPWWAVAAGAGVLLVLGYGVISGITARKKNAATDTSSDHRVTGEQVTGSAPA